MAAAPSSSPQAYKVCPCQWLTLDCIEDEERDWDCHKLMPGVTRDAPLGWCGTCWERQGNQDLKGVGECQSHPGVGSLHQPGHESVYYALLSWEGTEDVAQLVGCFA